MMATVCLNMIVKDEAHVIGRCLDSLKHLLDYWVIVDTGSTDSTREVILERMKGIPGELHERPWVNFSHNRNEALELARTKADYIFIIDADETVTVQPGFTWPTLDCDAYQVDIRYSGLHYKRIQLVRSSLGWKYEGVLHEYITSARARTQQTLCGIYINCYPDGARSQDPGKFLKDAAVLENALEKDPDNERYVFYLAQSYRDAGEPARAIEVYRQRASMGGWEQEVWYSLYQVARQLETTGAPWLETLEAYLAAYAYRPSRIEPMYHVVKHYNEEGNHANAYRFGKAAAHTARPSDVLFVEDNIYSFFFPLEYAICAHHKGDYETAVRLNDQVIAAINAPAALKEKAQQNKRLSLEALSVS